MCSERLMHRTGLELGPGPIAVAWRNTAGSAGIERGPWEWGCPEVGLPLSSVNFYTRNSKVLHRNWDLR